MKFKGITVGTYISKRPKGKFDESICTGCEKIKIRTLTKKNNMNYAKDAISFTFQKLVKLF